MSIQYCDYCDDHIDTDYNCEHFMPDDPIYECENEEYDAKRRLDEDRHVGLEEEEECLQE
jgi:hypothetical protein